MFIAILLQSSALVSLAWETMITLFVSPYLHHTHAMESIHILIIYT